MSRPNALGTAPPARRALADRLPSEETIAAAEFITGSLLENPRRIGKLLRDALTGIYGARLGRDWRILFEIDEIDEVRHLVIVFDIQHRSNAYRAR